MEPAVTLAARPELVAVAGLGRGVAVEEDQRVPLGVEAGDGSTSPVDPEHPLPERERPLRPLPGGAHSLHPKTPSCCCG